MKGRDGFAIRRSCPLSTMMLWCVSTEFITQFAHVIFDLFSDAIAGSRGKIGIKERDRQPTIRQQARWRYPAIGSVSKEWRTNPSPKQKAMNLAHRQVIDLIGGDDRDRTDDLSVANAALSQLSYIPTETLYLTRLAAPGQFKKPVFSGPIFC